MLSFISHSKYIADAKEKHLQIAEVLQVINKMCVEGKTGEEIACVSGSQGKQNYS